MALKVILKKCKELPNPDDEAFLVVSMVLVPDKSKRTPVVKRYSNKGTQTEVQTRATQTEVQTPPTLPVQGPPHFYELFSESDPHYMQYVHGGSMIAFKQLLETADTLAELWNS